MYDAKGLIARFMEKEGAVVLAVESSCDETAAAVLRGGREVLGSFVASQIETHREFGGVVPEIASRRHAEAVSAVVGAALKQAGIDTGGIDAVAVTAGPGLVGALTVGVSYAKALAFGLNLPLIGVNHIEGHICANFVAHQELEPPFLCLVASGGHSQVVMVRGYCDYELLSHTRDDAAGEALDKIARYIGLPYPGGPNLEKLAESGDANAIPLPGRFNAECTSEMSFSGLKTAAINHIRSAEAEGRNVNRADIAASFQKWVVDVLITKLKQAREIYPDVPVAACGGVLANGVLRRALAAEFGGVFVPPAALCTDNAAMIGCAGYLRLKAGHFSGLDLDARPVWNITE